MTVLGVTYPCAGLFRYQIGEVAYEQRWHVAGNGLAMDEPIEIDLPMAETPTQPVPTPPIRLDCIHRGSQVGERQCTSCSGKISLKVFACDIHKQTTIARQVDDLACCATCKDYEGKD